MTDDNKITIKVTDFGVICEFPSNMPSDAAHEMGKRLQTWLVQKDWLFVVAPYTVDVIDCRVTSNIDSAVDRKVEAATETVLRQVTGQVLSAWLYPKAGN